MEHPLTTYDAEGYRLAARRFVCLPRGAAGGAALLGAGRYATVSSAVEVALPPSSGRRRRLDFDPSTTGHWLRAVAVKRFRGGSLREGPGLPSHALRELAALQELGAVAADEGGDVAGCGSEDEGDVVGDGDGLRLPELPAEPAGAPARAWPVALAPCDNVVTLLARPFVRKGGLVAVLERCDCDLLDALDRTRHFINTARAAADAPPASAPAPVPALAPASFPLARPRVLRRLARGLLAGLARTHARGWLHRDVKPSNVLLSAARAQACLCDFGLAQRDPAARGGERAFARAAAPGLARARAPAPAPTPAPMRRDGDGDGDGEAAAAAWAEAAAALAVSDAAADAWVEEAAADAGEEVGEGEGEGEDADAEAEAEGWAGVEAGAVDAAMAAHARARACAQERREAQAQAQGKGQGGGLVAAARPPSPPRPQSPPPPAADGDGDGGDGGGGGDCGGSGAEDGYASLPPSPPPVSRWQGGLFPQVCSLEYRAPELLFGARRHGRGVDLWAAGCVLAELLRAVARLRRWGDGGGGGGGGGARAGETANGGGDEGEGEGEGEEDWEGVGGGPGLGLPLPLPAPAPATRPPPARAAPAPRLPPLAPWRPLFDAQPPGLAQARAPPGELAQLSALCARMGPPCAAVWPAAARLPGFMMADVACAFCGAPSEPSASCAALRLARPAPPPWLAAATLRDSCCGGEAQAHAQAQPLGQAQPRARAPLFHLHAALSLARWVVGESEGAGAAAPLPPLPPMQELTRAEAQGLDLVLRLLAYDPARRLGAARALEHPFLGPNPRGAGGDGGDADVAAEVDAEAEDVRGLRELARGLGAAVPPLHSEARGSAVRSDSGSG